MYINTIACVFANELAINKNVATDQDVPPRSAANWFRVLKPSPGHPLKVSL